MAKKDTALLVSLADGIIAKTDLDYHANAEDNEDDRNYRFPKSERMIL